MHHRLPIHMNSNEKLRAVRHDVIDFHPSKLIKRTSDEFLLLHHRSTGESLEHFSFYFVPWAMFRQHELKYGNNALNQFIALIEKSISRCNRLTRITLVRQSKLTLCFNSRVHPNPKHHSHSIARLLKNIPSRNTNHRFIRIGSTCHYCRPINFLPFCESDLKIIFIASTIINNSRALGEGESPSREGTMSIENVQQWSENVANWVFNKKKCCHLEWESWLLGIYWRFLR